MNGNQRMKKSLLLVMLFWLQSAIFSQEEMGWDAKFAIGGGFTPGWIIPDFNGINNKISDFGVGKFSSAGFFATGGCGYVSISVIKNIRIGGMGLGGSITNKGFKDGYHKEATYSTSMGGLTIEYSFPFIKDVAVSVGTLVGIGSTSLQLYQNSGNYGWNDIWEEVTNPNETTRNINRQISNTFFTIMPTLNVDIPLYRFFAFRIGGGYMIDLSKNWKADNDNTLNNVPSNLSSNALFIQAGIFIGYFNY
jgi:hypothetical protein